MVLVTGHKYLKMGGDHLYGRSDTHRSFAIYLFDPCFRVLMACLGQVQDQHQLNFSLKELCHYGVYIPYCWVRLFRSFRNLFFALGLWYSWL